MTRSTAFQFNRFELTILGILAAVMLLTRSHALTHLVHIPSTALASFFVLGYFVRRFTGFAGLFALGYAIDVVSISMLGVSDFCYTPAYAMLIPAYATMWLAGRYAARMPERLQSLPAMAVLVVAATFVSHLFSSGGFYFLGGRFPDPTIAEFLPRIARYFPFSLVSSLMWTGVAVALWALLLTARPELRRERSR
ncbi:hypothetical protein [Novosphingobium beihaiensis]|uniref:Uncharacterized protein n=1 Tax=Novosphingobium beihaiensis TaxID=2930389 RepID=A0ABT0BQ18_9SPHN|nr:hypothetical protein [Novosphingobium beihaiensis]MCJ2187145.1 hypothetical protein [Novosphingobium beihaiensis]